MEINTAAIRERQANRSYIASYDLGNGVKGLEVNTKKVTYQGKKWRDLSSTEKRKFENALVLSEPRQRLRFHYI